MGLVSGARLVQHNVLPEGVLRNDEALYCQPCHSPSIASEIAQDDNAASMARDERCELFLVLFRKARDRCPEGKDRLWPIHFWPSWLEPGHFLPKPILAKIGFGQNQFGPKPILANPFLANVSLSWCFCLLAQPSLHKGGAAGDLLITPAEGCLEKVDEGWEGALKGGGSEGWGRQVVEADFDQSKFGQLIEPAHLASQTIFAAILVQAILAQVQTPLCFSGW